SRVSLFFNTPPTTETYTLSLHDALPLASAFPGPSNNHRRKQAAVKLQFICDLLHSQVLHLSLSGFTRNDQAASPDILQVVRAGDLVIRDLGYFVLKVLEQLALKGASFLSRYRHDLLLHDAATGAVFNLAARLQPGQWLDQEVLLGKEKLAVRLVAIPLAEAVANHRARQARNNRDRRLHPSAQRLFLLGWNIFVTNVPRTLWPAQALGPIYRLRWRIEIIFKAWKSHLRLRELNVRTAELLGLSMMTKLLF